MHKKVFASGASPAQGRNRAQLEDALPEQSCWSLPPQRRIPTSPTTAVQRAPGANTLDFHQCGLRRPPVGHVRRKTKKLLVVVMGEATAQPKRRDLTLLMALRNPKPPEPNLPVNQSARAIVG